LIEQLAKLAKEGQITFANTPSEKKNEFLQTLSEALLKKEDEILFHNEKDLKEASHLEAAMIDRLSLKGRISGMAADVKKVAALSNPIGELFDQNSLPNGLKIYKMRVPIGLIGVIYEARPNVTVDITALATKTGNGVILRGGKETLHTNQYLVSLIQQSLEKCKLPKEIVQFVNSTDRALVKQMLQCDRWIDMIIPRGGAALHDFCKKNSTIPVITGGIGICHLFVDKSADLNKVTDVIINAKVQRPTVCNALDTLLVHEEIAKEFLPKVIQVLQKEHVEIRLDPIGWKIFHKGCLKAGNLDFDQEWLRLTLGIKVVKDLNEAIAHIQKHSSGHSDGILTEDPERANQFIQSIDSAAVYVNASTRFTDGAEFGLGAEVAISTQKLHARGPMGLKELTTYKWVIHGNYQVRK
jgi:glutamate-5-semialdehyde dehydrogenase